MDVDDKNEYDALVSLRDQAWREFEEKTRLEWRLSFGIWIAVLTCAGAIFKASALRGSLLLEFSAWIGAVIVIFVHMYFLIWIQSALRRSRSFQREAESGMRKLLNMKSASISPRKTAWKQPSVMIQILISFIVSGTFLVVVYALPKG